MKNILTYLLRDWPVHFVLVLTNWFPDNVIFLRLRGSLVRPFLGACGNHLAVGRNVTLNNPSHIHLGRDVHISYGSILIANDVIRIDDEVMFGPYCVLVSGNHTRRSGSFLLGGMHLQPIQIGAGAWLGAHVTVTAGSSIGAGSVIAANAVVTGDIPSDVLAGGAPARVIKTIQDAD